MLTLLFFLLGELSPTWALDSEARQTECRRGELESRDCHLKLGPYSLDLLDKTVVWSDGTWHSVDPMPLSGEGVEWSRIQFFKTDKYPLLQFWIWDKGVGEAAVSSEHWYVATLDDRKLRILAEGVVRKRRLTIRPEIVSTPAAPPKDAPSKESPPKPKYLYDQTERHGIKPLKAGEFRWTLGDQTKTIKVEP